MEINNTAAISLQTHLSMSKVSFFFNNKKIIVPKWNQIHIQNPSGKVFIFLQYLEKVCLVTITLAYISQIQNHRIMPASLMRQTQHLKWVKFEILQVCACFLKRIFRVLTKSSHYKQCCYFRLPLHQTLLVMLLLSSEVS